MNCLVTRIKLTTSVTEIIPAHILILFDVIGPFILSIINKSLPVGFVPEYLKHSVVKSLLKKSNLDVTVLSNFKPISI